MIHVEGPLLTVDVGSRESQSESIDEILKSFIGGRGVATKLAHRRIPFDTNPFGEENRLIFSTGPLQTSNMSFTGRMNCTGLSPLTDGLLSSNAGGFMSRNFADTGYSAVEIVGASDEPLVVHVTDETVEFEPVPDLWNAMTPELLSALEERHDLEPEHVACIGPAGENKVRFSSIITSGSRAFGRGGLGAVLGSKNVKAVTFRGDSRREIEVPDIQMDIHRDAATADDIMKRQGTSSVVDLGNEVKALPTRYFSERSFERADQINGDIVESKKFKRGTCSNCAFACKLPTKDEESGLETEGPEYETIMSFGTNAAVDDIVDIMQSNQLCDELGMDTISCGNVTSAYLAANDEFGNAELVHELVQKIAYREGIGDTLAEGIDRFHDELGVENWTVKGMDFAAHDGRALHGQGLSFAVANRGADHMYSTLYSWEYPFVGREEAVPSKGLDGKPSLLIAQENTRALEDSGVICRFSRSMVPPERRSELLDADYDDLLEVGDRIVTLERHFNNQRGFDRSNDTLPYDLPGFESALDQYYDQRGWNADGTVPESCLDTPLTD